LIRRNQVAWSIDAQAGLIGMTIMLSKV